MKCNLKSHGNVKFVSIPPILVQWKNRLRQQIATYSIYDWKNIPIATVHISQHLISNKVHQRESVCVCARAKVRRRMFAQHSETQLTVTNWNELSAQLRTCNIYSMLFIFWHLLFVLFPKWRFCTMSPKWYIAKNLGLTRALKFSFHSSQTTNSLNSSKKMCNANCIKKNLCLYWNISKKNYNLIWINILRLPNLLFIIENSNVWLLFWTYHLYWFIWANIIWQADLFGSPSRTAFVIHFGWSMAFSIQNVSQSMK